MADKIESMDLSGGQSTVPAITSVNEIDGPKPGEFVPGRRLYLDKDNKVVEANDPTRLTLLVSEFGSIPMARARALGLVTEGKAVKGPPEDRSIKGPDETKTAEPDIRMSKAELVAMAEERGITVVPDEMNKQQIIDAINGAK